MFSNTPSQKLIHKFYYHIDNGGITLEVYDTEAGEKDCVFPWMTLSESFHGYATGSLTFHNQGSDFLRQLGTALIVAADKLDTYTEDKLGKSKTTPH